VIIKLQRRQLMIETIFLGVLGFFSVIGFIKGGIHGLIYKFRLVLTFLFFVAGFTSTNQILLNALINNGFQTFLVGELFSDPYLLETSTFLADKVELLRVLNLNGFPSLITNILINNTLTTNSTEILSLSLADTLMKWISALATIIILLVISLISSNLLSKLIKNTLIGSNKSLTGTFQDHLIGLLVGIMKFTVITELIFISLITLTNAYPLLHPLLLSWVENTNEFSLIRLYFEFAKVLRNNI